MSPRIRVEIAGRQETSWTSLSITKSLECAAIAFEISFADTWTDEGQPWPFFEGDECKLFVNDALLLKGHLDTLMTEYSECDHLVHVAGRDVVGDLIDCSYVGPSDEFKGEQSLLDLAEAMARPFAIEVRSTISELPRLKDWKVDPGESVFETLERAARRCGVLLQSDGVGALLLVKAAPQPSGLQLLEGVNIERSEACYDTSARFSKYIVKGQNRNDLTVKKEAVDKGVDRHRPLVLLAEGEIDESYAQKRADWEASVRAARGIDVRIVTEGWLTALGSLWDVNQLVSVHSPRNRLYEEELLIKELVLSIDACDGTQAALTLTRAKAYQAVPALSERKKVEESDKELLRRMGYL